MKAFVLLLSLGLAFLSPIEENIIPQKEYVSFTLHNPSIKSIPLWIPGVMNPNLSPFSDSGVSLEIGQKIFFKNRGKKEVLLIVDTSIKEQRLNVSKLIKQRKKELGK